MKSSIKKADELLYHDELEEDVVEDKKGWGKEHVEQSEFIREVKLAPKSLSCFSAHASPVFPQTDVSDQRSHIPKVAILCACLGGREEVNELRFTS